MRTQSGILHRRVQWCKVTAAAAVEIWTLVAIVPDMPLFPVVLGYAIAFGMIEQTSIVETTTTGNVLEIKAGKDASKCGGSK